MSASKPSNKGVWPVIEPFVLGGASGMMATCCIQPLDMIKVRIQLLGEGSKTATTNPLVVGKNIIANEGFASLYKGLSAALLRQATYTTARLGIFRSLSSAMETPGKPTPFWKKTVAGLAAGGLGSIIGTPADVALIRMQADGTLPVDQRRNYTGVSNALIRIVREEGFNGMFKGCLPVVTRAMALNVGMLATHDQALDTIAQYTPNKVVQNFSAKMCAGFFASFFSLPFDFVKTRIQKQKKGPDGTFPYKSSIHCVQKVITEEGVFAFYRGFWTYYVRIAPHAMITLVAFDALKAMIPK